MTLRSSKSFGKEPARLFCSPLRAPTDLKYRRFSEILKQKIEALEIIAWQVHTAPPTFSRNQVALEFIQINRVL
jgi:hypothetical protein